MKRVLVLLGLLCTSIAAYASDNVLQTIEIQPVKDTYNIVLVSDKSVDVKKTVQASDKITLNLKDIRASKTLNTVYNNVSNVDTVMVEQQGNGVSIFFQADNAASASVTFDAPITAVPPVVNNKTQKLKLNNPIESYAPIYSEEVQPNKTSELFNRLKRSSEEIKDTMEDSDAGDTANKAFSFGLVGLLVFAVIRLFKRKEPEMKIGLSQSMAEREMDLYKNQQIGLTYQNAEKPFTTVNYGLNAYQKESRNPYESSPMTIHNPRLNNYANNFSQNSAQSQVQAQQSVQAPTVTALKQPKKKVAPQTNPVSNVSNSNIDNLKFIESMTAIYEKSGRHDLARGLKASLSKNNIQ